MSVNRTPDGAPSGACIQSSVVCLRNYQQQVLRHTGPPTSMKWPLLCDWCAVSQAQRGDTEHVDSCLAQMARVPCLGCDNC